MSEKKTPPPMQHVRSAPKAAREALRLVPTPRLRGKAPRTDGPVPGAPGARGLRRARPAVEAWEKIAAPLRGGKAIRVLFFGVTGRGKTYGLIDFLDYVVAGKLVDLILIHDVKLAAPQYRGEVIHEAAELYTHPPASYPAIRVLRKRDLDHSPSVEGAARVTLATGYLGVPTLLVVDEFQRALTDGGSYESKSVQRVFCEGYGLGASIVGTKQLPQFTPTTAMAQSDLVVFGLSGKGASYLVDERYTSQAAGAVITSLTARHFVLVPAEGDWDGEIYQVPERRA